MYTRMMTAGVCGAMTLVLACVVPNPELAHGDEATTTTDEGNRPESESQADGSEASTNSSADSSTESSTEPVSDSSTDSGSDSGSGSGADSSTDSSETGATEGGTLCPLVSEVGDGCQTCVDLYCCEAVSLCQLEEDCTCLLDCLLTGEASTLCEATCGLGVALPSLVTTLDCLDQHCSDDCPSLL